MDFTDKLDILYARRSSEDGKDGESFVHIKNLAYCVKNGFNHLCFLYIMRSAAFLYYIQSFHKFMLRIL